MAYEVLARKWRPDRFTSMVGQEHVLRALVHALESDRLHHAYLFTGTRGVGKTTVARILARCLNCERGVGPEPCGECSSCTEIAEGRFVDLIEVDAASRTRVEDTRELLDNVQYAPTRGRYKVYLIDEVHMLTTHSFNALLKTLEEPPPHVKFLLATTDPKKLPITVLSRCLQFHLKNLTPERISDYLEGVLAEEGVEAESAALRAIARAADGSMRDALSLTDQAISHGGGRLVADEVAHMLGTIDQQALGRVISALASGDARALISCVDDLAEHAADFQEVLSELMSVLHQVAVAQALPTAELDERAADAEVVRSASDRLTPEDVQLYYQIALTGVRDLPWAPDMRSGFEMTLLRMLAFRPEVPGSAPRGPSGVETNSDSGGAASGGDGSGSESPTGSAASGAATTGAAISGAGSAGTKPSDAHASTAGANCVGAKSQSLPSPAAREETDPSRVGAGEDASGRPSPIDENSTSGRSTSGVATSPDPAPPQKETVAESSAMDAAPAADVSTEDVGAGEGATPGELRRPEDWHRAVRELALEGLTREFAAHCYPTRIEDSSIELMLSAEASGLQDEAHVDRVRTALGVWLGREVSVQVRLASEPADTPGETPAQRALRLREEAQVRAVRAIETDPLVQDLVRVFDAEVPRDRIRPR